MTDNLYRPSESRRSELDLWLRKWAAAGAGRADMAQAGGTEPRIIARCHEIRGCMALKSNLRLGSSMALIVQKYGGTSVGTVERIQGVANKVKGFRDQGHDVVVVVSAMSGETNPFDWHGQ